MKYLIKPVNANSIFETEWFTNKHYQSSISVATQWRRGSYNITVDDISDMPRDINVNDNGIVVSNYEWELGYTMDGISVDIQIDRADGVSATEEQSLDFLEVTLEDGPEYYDILVEDGWEPVDITIEIFGPVTIELLDD